MTKFFESLLVAPFTQSFLNHPHDAFSSEAKTSLPVQLDRSHLFSIE